MGRKILPRREAEMPCVWGEQAYGLDRRTDETESDSEVSWHLHRLTMLVTTCMLNVLHKDAWWHRVRLSLFNY